MHNIINEILSETIGLIYWNGLDDWVIAIINMVSI